MNRPAIVLGLSLVLTIGCTSEPVEPETTAAPEPESDPVPLEECPADEAPWQDALRVAREAGELEAFAERATELAATCPTLWAPRRAAGDALYLMPPSCATDEELDQLADAALDLAVYADELARS